MPSERVEDAKKILRELRAALSKTERRALAQYLWSFFDADDDIDVGKVVHPLDQSYLDMKADTEKLQSETKVLAAVIKIGKIAIRLALR